MIFRTWTKLKNILTREQNEILSAASVLMILGLVTKVSGMFYLQLFTREYDLRTEGDPFRLASIIPEYITDTILMGAISGSIIPIFIKLRKKSGNDAFLTSFSYTFNLCMLVLIVLTVTAAIFANQLVPLAVKIARPAVPPSADQIGQIAWMMRALLVPQIILAVSGFMSSTLNIYNRFIIPQLAPLFFNVGRILALLLLAPLIGGSIWAVIWGSWIAAMLHLIVQLPLVWHLGIRVKLFAIDFRDDKLRQVLKVGLPRIISLSVEEVRIAINTILAFGFSAASTFDLGNRLITFPLTFIGYSFATASFTTFSKLYDQGEKQKFEELVGQIINQALFLAIPISAAFIVLRVPIVRLSYGLFQGELTWPETLRIAWVVLFFSIGLSFETLRVIMLRIFYSIHNTFIPMISSFSIVVIGLVVGILLSNYLSHFEIFSFKALVWEPSYFFEKENGAAGIGGLALSSSLIYILEFFFFLFWLKRLKAISQLSPIFKGILKKIVAGIVMMIAMYAMAKLWEEVLNTTKIVQLALLTFTTLSASFILYIWTSFILQVPEVETFADFVLRRLRKFVPF